MDQIARMICGALPVNRPRCGPGSDRTMIDEEHIMLYLWIFKVPVTMTSSASKRRGRFR